MNKTEFSNEIIKNKIKVSLAMLGFNERYISFEYLADILTYMILKESDSVENFNNSINIIGKKYNISKTAIIYGLKKITDTCLDQQIYSKAQYNLKRNCIINRIRVLKSHTANMLFTI